MSALSRAGTQCLEPRRHGTGTSADHGSTCRRRVSRCVRVTGRGEELLHVHVCGGCSHVVKTPEHGIASSLSIPVGECTEVADG